MLRLTHTNTMWNSYAALLISTTALGGSPPPETACTQAGAQPLPTALPSLKGASVYAFGLSAGASMAVQVQVAFSSTFSGAAVFAGKPYWCEQGAGRAVSHGDTDNCLRHPEKVNVSELVAYARASAVSGAIDDLEHLSRGRVFIYHGKNDHTYRNGSLNNTAAFYDAVVNLRKGGAVVRCINEIDSDHAIPTDAFGSKCGNGESEDGCENCDFDGAGAALSAMFNTTSSSSGSSAPWPLAPKASSFDESDLITFDQRPFQNNDGEPQDWRNGLTDTGLLYIPPSCNGAKARGCTLVLLFHGCNGYCDIPYVLHNGLLAYAATNSLVVLAPQVGANYTGGGPATGTFQTCFDNYGDTGPDYSIKNGTQMVAVKRMIDAIMGTAAATAHSTIDTTLSPSTVKSFLAQKGGLHASSVPNCSEVMEYICTAVCPTSYGLSCLSGPNQQGCHECAIMSLASIFPFCPGGIDVIDSICGVVPEAKVAVEVTIPALGRVRGYHLASRTHDFFRGVPFAAPPIGALRWRAPAAVERWEGVLDATQFKPACKQLGEPCGWASIQGQAASSEDCLYLNVYAPPSSTFARYAAAAEGNFSGFPVMVFGPAGQFLWGSANDLENREAPQFQSASDVIYVTMNYRLGALGFLALPELRQRESSMEGVDAGTGNYGTQDQRAALRWVQQNIRAFGGDSNKVTLMGESSGATIASVHTVLPKSFGLFRSAIASSGAFNTWSAKNLSHAYANGRAFAHNLGCAQFGSDVDIECLVKIDAETLASFGDDCGGNATAQVNNLPYADQVDASTWGPTLDGVEMDTHPAILLAEGKLSPSLTSFLLGSNRDEGATFAYFQTGHGGNERSTTDFYKSPVLPYSQWAHSTPPFDPRLKPFVLQNMSNFVHWASQWFSNTDDPVGLPQRLAKMACYRPTKTPSTPPGGFDPPAGNGSGLPDWWWSVTRVIGDDVVGCSTARAAQLLANLSSVQTYRYFFNHTPLFTVNENGNLGAFHGSEVPFTWGDSFELLGDGESALSEAMVEYWTNFAWSGDPNVGAPVRDAAAAATSSSSAATRWPEYTAATPTTLVFGNGDRASPTSTPNVSRVERFKELDCAWWPSAHPELYPSNLGAHE